MVGKIPGESDPHVYVQNNSHTQRSIGLVSIQSGPPLPVSIPRAQGFDMGLVAVLETAEHVVTYGIHPAHLE